MIKHKLLTRSGLLSLGLALFFSCSQKEEVRDVKALEGSGQATAVDYDAKLQALVSSQERILAAPEDVSLRRLLVSAGVDSVHKKYYAAGLGRPPLQATNSAMAAQAAERAAYIDGCRWLAYIKAWQQDLQTPFGSIQGQIPPSRLVHKKVQGEQVQALVEADW